MSRNFLDLCKQFRQEVGLSGTGPTSVESQVGDMKRVVDWVQKADFEIQRLWRNWSFHWSLQTVAIVGGTSVYPVVSRPVSGTLRLADSTEVFLVSWEKFREYPTGVQQASPQVAAVSPAGALHLWPTPQSSDTLAFEGYTKPVRMTGNADQSLIPEEHRDVIIYRAKMYYAEFENAPEVAQSASAAYMEALDRLERDQLPDTDASVGLGGEDYGRVEVA